MLREEREKRRRRGKGGRSRAGAAEFAAAVALPCRRKARTARERTAKREGDRISSPRSQRRRRPHRGSTPSRLATAATTKLAVVAIEAEERESVFAKRGRARAHEGEERRKGKEKQKTMNPGEKEEVCSRTVLLCTQISLRVVMVFPAVTVAIAVYAVCSCHHPPRSSHLLTEYYGSGETKKVSWRESQLKGLRRFLIEKEEDILKALMLDLGKHQVEAFRDEIGTLMKSLNFALSNLKYWVSGKKAKLPQIALLSSAEIVPEPLGLVLIISSWNFPFGLSLEPLIGAVAAGNTVVLKPSELSPACSSILALGLPNFLDNKAIKVVQGGPHESQHLLQQKWDKIFFTGSARVGKIVMSAAAKHLTPVTLELGGKCPAVVDSLSSSWDLEVAVKRILVGKYGACGGQACIAIDYVLVENQYYPKLVELMKLWIKKMFGENPKDSNTIARIVNKQHLSRLKNLLADPEIKKSVVYGGYMDERNLFIEPTILLNPPLESAIMTEEIFGPLLPIITVDKIEDSIKFISSRPKPLALYVFSKDKTLQNRMISETSSGSLTFNDAILQYAADSLPFGGVGESGFGMYHGKFSFDTFSSQKAVVRRSFLTDFWYRYPPWTLNKFQLLEVSYNYDYLGLLLVLLGLKTPSKRRSYFANP